MSKSEQRKKREDAAEKFANAVENFNGNPDTKDALMAIAEYLNIDIEV